MGERKVDRRTWVDPDRPGDNQGAVAAHVSPGYHSTPIKMDGSVAEWLACWTQAQ